MLVEASVRKVVSNYPEEAQSLFYVLRALLFDVAKHTSQIGKIEETLRWGEPAYLTSESKSGSTIRIAWNAKVPECMGIYFNCRTTLVESFRKKFGDVLHFKGNRAIYLPLCETLIDVSIIKECFFAALTYHLPGK